MTSVGLLSLPPEIIQKILVHVFRTSTEHPSETASTITSSNEEIFSDFYSLPSLQPHIESLIRHVKIDWTCTVAPRVLSRFASRIKSLSISRHRRAPMYIAALEQAPLESIRLVDVTVPPFLGKISRPERLKELSLCFVTASLDRHGGFALESLELAGVAGLKHTTLVGLLSRNLKSLHLRYLRHPSINDKTLTAIASCDSLEHLTLSHLRNCKSLAVSRLIRCYPGLHGLTLAATQISSHALCSFLESATQLTHLSVEEPSWTTAQTEFFIQNVNNPLKSFELRGVPGLTDTDVRHLVYRMETLESLSLRRHLLLSVFSAISISTLPIKKLNLRGVFFLCDPALSFLAELPLEEVSLGGDGQVILNYQPGPDECVSNNGMEVFLKRSANLKKFFWESLRTSNGSTMIQYAGQLDGATLAKLLKRYCTKLQKVEVNWLKPRVVNMATRAQAARCDLSFLELEEATGAEVLLDEKALY